MCLQGLPVPSPYASHIVCVCQDCLHRHPMHLMLFVSARTACTITLCIPCCLCLPGLPAPSPSASHVVYVCQDCLHHHPVHKISFIAQDMTDTRAFGYIFGSPDAGHKFFGIKTEKTASQVVIAMRDLFQVNSPLSQVVIAMRDLFQVNSPLSQVVIAMRDLFQVNSPLSLLISVGFRKQW